MPTSKKQVLAISGMGVYGKVANFAALPNPALHDGETWIALASQGTAWLPGSLGGTFYDKGQYYSDGTIWIYDSNSYQASQSDVNTGTITDQWVSPSTLANSIWAFTTAKVLATLLAGLSVATGGVITSADSILQALGKLQYQITNLSTIYQALLDTFTTITVLPDTLTAAQANTWIRVNVAADGNLNVPPNASVSIPVGSKYYIRQSGVGKVTLVAGAGVTLNAPSAVLTTGQQYDVIRMVKQATDSWLVEVGAASWYTSIIIPALALKANLSGATFTGAISATNLSGTNTGDETAARIATINHAATLKVGLVDADEITGQDSAAGFGLLRTTLLNVYTYLKGKFDLIYNPIKFSYCDGTIGTISSTNANTISKWVLIPANTFVPSTPGKSLMIQSKYKKSGSSSFGSASIYINTVNSFSGATLLGTMSTFGNNTFTYLGLSRTIPIQTGSFDITSVSGGSEDTISAGFLSVTIDWTVDQYILSVVKSNVAADTMWSTFLMALQT